MAEEPTNNSEGRIMTMARAAAFADSGTLMAALREPAVLSAHGRTMARVLRECRLRDDEAVGVEAEEEVDPRALCMAYLVVFHPPPEHSAVIILAGEGTNNANHNTNNNNERLQTVQVLGREVLERFEALSEHLRLMDVTSLPEVLTRGFIGLFAEYKAALMAWQSPQLDRLRRRLRHALLALYRAQACVAPDAPEALLEEMTLQIERLRAKALGLPGGAAQLEAIDGERGAMEATADNNNNTTSWGDPALAPTEWVVLRLLLGETAAIVDLEQDPRVVRLRAGMMACASLVEALQTGLVRLVNTAAAGLGDHADDATLARIAELFSSRSSSSAGDVELLRCVNDECLTPLEAHFQAAQTPTAEAPVTLTATCERLIRLQVACANRRLAATAPILQRHGVAYLRGQMEDRLAALGGNSNNDGLPRTRAWLAQHAPTTSATSTIDTTVLLGFVSTLVLPLAEMPETLMCVEYEGGWIPRWRAELTFLVSVGSILVLLLSGGSDAAQVPEPAATAVWRWAVGSAEETEEALLAQVLMATPAPDALLLRRALMFLRARVIVGPQQQQSNDADELPTPLAPRLRALADEVRRVALIHADAHGALYARLGLGI